MQAAHTTRGGTGSTRTPCFEQKHRGEGEAAPHAQRCSGLAGEPLFSVQAAGCLEELSCVAERAGEAGALQRGMSSSPAGVRGNFRASTLRFDTLSRCGDKKNRCGYRINAFTGEQLQWMRPAHPRSAAPPPPPPRARGARACMRCIDPNVVIELCTGSSFERVVSQSFRRTPSSTVLGAPGADRGDSRDQMAQSAATSVAGAIATDEVDGVQAALRVRQLYERVIHPSPSPRLLVVSVNETSDASSPSMAAGTSLVPLLHQCGAPTPAPALEGESACLQKSRQRQQWSPAAAITRRASSVLR